MLKNDDTIFYPLSPIDQGLMELQNEINKEEKKKGIFSYMLFLVKSRGIPKKIFNFSLLLLLFLVLIYTRVVGLNWGLPYPMHPDERNMANAITSMTCESVILPPLSPNPFGYIRALGVSLGSCYNPKFFAYGQFPLYLGKYFGGLISGKEILNYSEAVMGLRLLSALSSILTIVVLMLIVRKLKNKSLSYFEFISSFLIFTFTPYAVQFSHFGTTESFLMFLYVSLIYLSLLLTKSKLETGVRFFSTLSLIVLLLAVSIATKLSSLLFFALPALALIISIFKSHGFWATKFWAFICLFSFLVLGGFVGSFLFSPHNLFSMTEYISTMNYESSVGTGASRVFYTRQFEHTLPILFQIRHVFPYILGIGQIFLLIFAFISVKRNRMNSLLLFSFLAVFLPSALLYAKWTRFIAPSLPVLSIFVYLGFVGFMSAVANLFKNKQFYWVRNVIGAIVLIWAILPGVAYLHIYQTPDVRFSASKWLFDNLKDGDIILSETANVVDVPVPSNLTKTMTAYPKINYISFPSYDLDISPDLKTKFDTDLSTANWIFMPSRRVVANHTCFDWRTQGTLKSFADWSYSTQRCGYYDKTYPKLGEYYSKLLSNSLPFEKVAEFDSYPKIVLAGKTIYEIKDERAEETWTVFDHPVLRFYKRK